MQTAIFEKPAIAPTEEWAPRFEAATALWIGQRENQEDAIISDFHVDAEHGYFVLADGMGGHTSGEIASALVLTEVFSELKLKVSDALAVESFVPNALKAAANLANESIKEAAEMNPECRGMGSTLVAPFFIQDRLYWVSVGDSPFFRVRDGQLIQLNEDHSMASDIDLMVENGMMDAEQGKNHPDRNCLTSAIAGAPIRHIDCPGTPQTVIEDDIYILASDGLQTLTNDEIRDIVWNNRNKAPDLITKLLLSAVKDADDPDQDNVSIALVKAANQSSIVSIV